MKIIDEKGRLFKKINILDLVVIMFFILFGVTAYFGITAPERVSRIISGEPHYKMVIVKVVLDREFLPLFGSVIAGDAQIGRFKKVIAEIIGKNLIDAEGGRFAVINLKVCSVDQVGGVLTFAGRILKPGEVFNFDSERIKLSGRILSVGEL